MKKLSKLKLTQLGKSELDVRQMNALQGGGGCVCACTCFHCICMGGAADMDMNDDGWTDRIAEISAGGNSEECSVWTCY